jgi:hypothetical protein
MISAEKKTALVSAIDALGFDVVSMNDNGQPGEANSPQAESLHIALRPKLVAVASSEGSDV